MTLGELILYLERQDQDLILPFGFGRAHSYRGYYEDLAFTPERDVHVRAMLAEAKYALGHTYEGYKGGDYTMKEYTEVWLAEYGTSKADGISLWMLRFWIILGKHPELAHVIKEIT